MKTTLALLTAVLGLATFAQAGPNYPGFIFQQAPVKKADAAVRPAGPRCSMQRTETVDFGGRRGGPGYAVSKTVDCTGWKCCKTPAAEAPSCCAAMR